MLWSDIPRDPPPRILRQFAGVWLVFFTGLACWQGLVRGNLTLAALFAVLAVGLGPLGLAIPRAIRPIYVGAMLVTAPIGWVVSQVILALVFYGVFTPVALVFRLIGRDALSRAPRPDQESYWQPKPAPADMKRYFRQF
jgi:Saxitoxin biosynthesis operon protein SxtJ